MIKNLLLKWLKVAPTIQIIQRETIDMRLEEWRNNQNLTQAMGKLMSDRTMRMALCVLQNENPANMVLQLGVSPNDRLTLQARTEGYQMALNNLQAMAKHLKPKGTVETTFEPENPNQKPNYGNRRS